VEQDILDSIAEPCPDWEGKEVLVTLYHLYPGVASAVPSSRKEDVEGFLGTLRCFEDEKRFEVHEGGELIAEIHAVYRIEAEDGRLFIEGWVGDPTNHKWSKWVVEEIR